MGKNADVVIIIGAGQAGVACAETLRKENEKIKITMVDYDPDSFYYRASMKYYIKGAITKQQLVGRPECYFKKLDIEFIHGTVEMIDRTTKKIQIKHSDGEIISLDYSYLVLATGSRPFYPSISGVGSEFDSMRGMRSLEDSAHIIDCAKTCSENDNIVVVGGGVLGLELAASLRDQFKQIRITLIVREPRIGFRFLDSKASTLLHKKFEEKKISILLNETVQRVEKVSSAQGSNKYKISTISGTQVDCSFVFYCTGVQSESDLAKNSGLEVNQGILVNDYLQTSDPDIYAIGDCAEIKFAHGKTMVRRLWAIAGMMGQTAALNINRRTQQKNKPDAQLSAILFTPGALHIYTRLCNLNYHAIGEYEVDLKQDYEILDSIDQTGNYLKLVLKSNVLVGAVILGESKDPIILKRLIEKKTNIPSHLKQEILKKGFDYEMLLY